VQLVTSFLKQLGALSVIAADLFALARPFFQAWLSRRIDAGVEEGLRKRLATFQLELDKDLERHRATLTADADRLRSGLERDTIDYGIYATKRHEAVAGPFAEYLRAEVLVTNMTDLAPESADEVEGMQPERTQRALKARNDAYEAYFKYALYLPESMEGIAIAVRDHFHVASLPYVPHDEPETMIVRDKVRLRQLMPDYLNAARADLARGASVREPRPLPAPAAPRDSDRRWER
jgi:hypothetical protein